MSKKFTIVDKYSHRIEFDTLDELQSIIQPSIDKKIANGLLTYKSAFKKFALRTWSNTNHFGWPRNSIHICFEVEMSPEDPGNPTIPWKSLEPVNHYDSPYFQKLDYSNKRALVTVTDIGCVIGFHYEWKETDSRTYREINDKTLNDLGLSEYKDDDRVEWGWQNNL